MSVLYIAEFSQVGGDSLGMGMAVTPPLAEQTVAIGGASVQSGAFNAATRLVRIATDVVCSIAFGTNPTATTVNMRLAAGQTEYFVVRAGAKVAVVANT